MPTAYTQKKGVMVASVIFKQISGKDQYMPELYQQFDAADFGMAFTYGYTDNIELTFTAGNLGREIDYTSGLQIDDSKLLFGFGAKAGFGTLADKYQIAGGFNATYFEDRDRDIILDTDYETISNLYAAISTDTQHFNGHLTWKFVNYHHSSSSRPYTGHLPGGGVDSGLAPPSAHWGELCLGFEYKIPDSKFRVISELVKSEISFGSESNKSINLAVQAEINKMNFKLYTRKINQDSRSELGLISTYFF